MTPGGESTERTWVDRYRLVVERHGKWSAKWRWALEESRYTDWQLKREGFAWTLAGAEAKGRRAQYWSTLGRLQRYEVLYVRESVWVPEPTRESPIPARLVNE